MQYLCGKCNIAYIISPLRYKCDCGSPLTLKKDTSYSYQWDDSTPSLWRYRDALPIPADADIVTLGEGITPVVPLYPSDNPKHFVKLDYLCPTGSYKDRGASVLLTHLKAMGVDAVVEDSSGNAGAAIAASSARAGIHCTIYCPDSTSEGKLKQIAAYGASLKLVPGNRMATTEAVQHAAENTCYASHNWNPFFLEGTKTLAFEITEQFGDSLPQHIICPVGFGSIYLGLYLGFSELYDAGVIDRVPRLLGVQPATCCPIYNAYRDKTPTPISRMPQTAQTFAEGITAELPVRSEMLLDAIRFSDGAFATVDDADILAGMRTLAEQGIYVEPTSAVVINGYEKFRHDGVIQDGDVTVSILTGSGLKCSFPPPVGAVS